MIDNVTYKKFDDCIESVKYTTKLQSKDYLPEGKYPIISQEEDLISGYWNNDNDVFRAPRPLVIFGDHTRVLKYVDFDFVLGADGVKILLPTEDIMAKYLLYYLKWYNIPSLGYSRHFKLLREISVPVPSLEDQQRIVRELDAIHAILSAKNEQLRELDNLAQAIFYSMFGDPISNEKGWEVKPFADLCGELFAGGDVPKDDVSEHRDEKHPYPIYSNGIKADGLYGYTSKCRVNSPAITISARGTIGATYIRREPFFPVVRLISAIPKNNVDIVYFSECVKKIDVVSNGNSIPQLTVPMLKAYKLPLPPLDLQQAFASKITAIEQQKELIRASIAETETLLAARMQHYFD